MVGNMATYMRNVQGVIESVCPMQQGCRRLKANYFIGGPVAPMRSIATCVVKRDTYEDTEVRTVCFCQCVCMCTYIYIYIYIYMNLHVYIYVCILVEKVNNSGKRWHGMHVVCLSKLVSCVHRCADSRSHYLQVHVLRTHSSQGVRES